MIIINSTNYNYYKKLDSIIWEFLAPKMGLDLTSEYSPIKIQNAYETKSMTLAKKALKSSITEFLTVSNHMTDEMRIEFDDMLLKHGFPNSRLLAATIKGTHSKVLKRGKIRDLTEFYLIKEMTSYVDSNITEQERSELDRLCFEFENASHKQNGS